MKRTVTRDDDNINNNNNNNNNNNFITLCTFQPQENESQTSIRPWDKLDMAQQCSLFDRNSNTESKGEIISLLTRDMKSYGVANFQMLTSYQQQPEKKCRNFLKINPSSFYIGDTFKRSKSEFFTIRRLFRFECKSQQVILLLFLLVHYIP